MTIGGNVWPTALPQATFVTFCDQILDFFFVSFPLALTSFGGQGFREIPLSSALFICDGFLANHECSMCHTAIKNPLFPCSLHPCGHGQYCPSASVISPTLRKASQPTFSDMRWFKKPFIYWNRLYNGKHILVLPRPSLEQCFRNCPRVSSSFAL